MRRAEFPLAAPCRARRVRPFIAWVAGAVSGPDNNMFSRRTKLLGLRLALTDLAVTVIAFELAYMLRQQLPALRLFYLERGMMVGLMSSALVIWWLVGAGIGLYRRPKLFETAHIARDTVRQAVWGTAALMCWLYLLKLGDVSRLFILLFVTINTLLLLVSRLSTRSLRRIRRGEAVGKSYHVIVGGGENAVELGRLIEANEDLGAEVLAFVRESPAAEGNDAAPRVLEAPDLRRSYPLRELHHLSQMLEDQVVDEIIFAVTWQRLQEMEEIFLKCEEEGVRVRVLANFFPHVSSNVYMEKLHSLPLLTFSTTPENDYLLFLKRVFDVTAAVGLLLLFSPLLAIACLAIRLTSKGPVLFSQVRCGLNGRRFRFYKLRSMYEDAPARRAEVAHMNEMDGPVFKCSHDPRITPLGRFLRKFSIDEWPQLLNVIKGDMSFVGPRPPLVEEVQQYQRWQRRRLRMKPGLTSLWAVEGRSKLDFLSWMRLDLHYIDHWSLLLDLKIMLRSIPHVLSGKGV